MKLSAEGKGEDFVKALANIAADGKKRDELVCFVSFPVAFWLRTTDFFRDELWDLSCPP